jgi:hypothetical protein
VLAAAALVLALLFWAKAGTTGASSPTPRQRSVPLSTRLRVAVAPGSVRTLLRTLHVRVARAPDGIVVVVPNAEEYERTVSRLESRAAGADTVGPTDVTVVTASPAFTAQPVADQVK